VTAGVYYLSTPVIIDRSSVDIRGENMGGDLFFAGDSFYNGFFNKTATVFVADGHDAFRVGASETCRAEGGQCLVLGIAFSNFGITGVSAQGAGHDMFDGTYTAGAGIRVEKVRLFSLPFFPFP
jgi:hypothetical protein